MMDWLTFSARMIEALVWPAVAVVLLLLVRPHIRGLAARVESFKVFGAEANFVPGPFVANLPSVTSIAQRIEALNPAQALVTAKLLEPNFAGRSAELRAKLVRLDPMQKRFVDGAAAKRVLLRWQVSDDRDPASLKQWTDALDIAERT